MGGGALQKSLDFPGSFYAKNITPEGIGNWTNGELLRAIACGVNRDRKSIFSGDALPILQLNG
jgi:hypothetical protein